MNEKDISEKVQESCRARCPTYEHEKSMTYTPVGRALPPLAGSAYGMTSPATHYDGD